MNPYSITRLHDPLPTLEDAISGRRPRLPSGGWSTPASKPTRQFVKARSIPNTLGFHLSRRSSATPEPPNRFPQLRCSPSHRALHPRPATVPPSSLPQPRRRRRPLAPRVHPDLYTQLSRCSASWRKRRLHLNIPEGYVYNDQRVHPGESPRQPTQAPKVRRQPPPHPQPPPPFLSPIPPPNPHHSPNAPRPTPASPRTPHPALFLRATDLRIVHYYGFR